MISFIFAKLKKMAEHFIGREVQNAVISIPSYYSNSSKNNLVKAA
jgi:molecular chaperone DnaK (HSP70)